MTQPFLIEVGCEEIPARFLASLSVQFFLSMGGQLQDSGLRIPEVELQSAYTPRRLAVWIDKILARQADCEEETVGPPVKAAYDAQGSFTPAAVNFAKKFGAQARDLYKVTTPKGEYVALRRNIAGQSAAELLPGMIQRAWDQLELPRSMQWDESGFRFIRPVRWLVALLGNEIIPVRLGEVDSGRVTRGHRTLGSQTIELKNADSSEYTKLLEKNFVLARPEARRERIQTGLMKHTQENGLRAVEDAELLEILVNLTEYPTVIRGEFDRQFLELPREVLVMVMRNHQRYFAVEKIINGGNRIELTSSFFAVGNQDKDRDGLIRQGHERVLRARFNDALFFWNHDRQRPLASRLEDLKHITFHAKLGSYYDKTQRMLRPELIDFLAAHFEEDKVALRQAITLCKCDLGTDLVKEFTELQGQIGGLITELEGMKSEVGLAIYDHYKPAGRFDPVPRHPVLAMADKLDTLAGMFSLGEIPSGSRDPFALRRAGNGVVRILNEYTKSMPLKGAIDIALNAYNLAPDVHANALRQLRQFFAERQEFYLHEIKLLPHEEVRAILNAIRTDDPLDAADDPYDDGLRLQALHAVRNDEPAIFAQAAEVFKRMRNIVEQAGNLLDWWKKGFYPNNLRLSAEKNLYSQIDTIGYLKKTSSLDLYKNYLLQSARLAPLVETYFQEVRVNDPDPELRDQRLAFLAWATVKLGHVADLSRLAIT